MSLDITQQRYTDGKPNLRRFHQARWDEPIIFELSQPGGRGIPVPEVEAGIREAVGDPLATLYLAGRVSRLREAEVMDVDEAAVRRGVVAARLYGYLKIPAERRLTQSLKTPSGPGEQAAMDAIAAQVVESMQPGWLYVLGPGTSTRAIADRLGLPKTLVGVDVVSRGDPCGRPEHPPRVTGKLVATDANESQLLDLLRDRHAKIVVTPIGGQGYLFGRGNQQISPQVIQRVGRENIVVVSTPDKIHALGGRPLRVDTGDEAVDRLLNGYVRVLIGYGEQVVYRVSC